MAAMKREREGGSSEDDLRGFIWVGETIRGPSLLSQMYMHSFSRQARLKIKGTAATAGGMFVYNRIRVVFM